MRVLEVGPTTIPSEFKSDLPDVLWEYADIEKRENCHLVQPYIYPIENKYDIVFSANVLEHVPAPWRLMKEWARVTKPRGHVITIVPVSWPYHEWPMDCWRMFPEALKALHEEAGLITILTEWGSLEYSLFPQLGIPADKTTIPGRSITWLSDEERQAPMVEIAYDSIGIALKP